MSTQKNEQPTQHEIADANRHTGESCGEVSGGFICTRTPGHTGLHVASNGTEGVKSWPITPPADTTGSGREGETPETDAVETTRIALGQPRTPAYGDMMACSKRIERQRDAALAQVEALRRAAKEFEKQVARRLWTSDDGVNIRDSDPGDYIDDDPALATAWSLFRAAIDSAQRQEAE